MTLPTALCGLNRHILGLNESRQLNDKGRLISFYSIGFWMMGAFFSMLVSFRGLVRLLGNNVYYVKYNVTPLNTASNPPNQTIRAVISNKPHASGERS